MWGRGLESKFSFMFRFGFELLFLFSPCFFLEVLKTTAALGSLPLTEPQPLLFPLSSLCSTPVTSLFASSQGRVGGGLWLLRTGCGRAGWLSLEGDPWSLLVKEPICSEPERSQRCFYKVRFTQRSDSWLGTHVVLVYLGITLPKQVFISILFPWEAGCGSGMEPQTL